MAGTGGYMAPRVCAFAATGAAGLHDFQFEIRLALVRICPGLLQRFKEKTEVRRRKDKADLVVPVAEVLAAVKELAVGL